MMTAIPLSSDRSAKDVVNYPALHASDLPSTPIHHVPAGSQIGHMLTWNGSKWVAGYPQPLILLGTMEGELALAETPFKIYNLYGADRTITKVFLSVDVAPVGNDIIVDVKLDGASIFTGGNAPKIVASAYTGYSITIETPTWEQDSYLTWEVTQTGSSVIGEGLTVHIVHR